MHGGHRVRAILVRARLPCRGGMVPEGERAARGALVAAVTRGDHPRARGRSAVLQTDVGSDPPVGGDRLAAPGCRTASAAASSARRDRRSATARRRLRARRGSGASGMAAGGTRAPVDRHPTRPDPHAIRIDARGTRPHRAGIAALSSAPRTTADRGARGAAAFTIDDVPAPLLTAFAAAFGAVIGSFLNVCIYRLPIGKSVMWAGAACPGCNRALSWYENIPIVSWIALRARCRSCGSAIGIRYPIIEALTAAMFGVAWWYYGPGVLLASRLVFWCARGVVFAVGVAHHKQQRR